jgi:hypothetical protein
MKAVDGSKLHKFLFQVVNEFVYTIIFYFTGQFMQYILYITNADGGMLL